MGKNAAATLSSLTKNLLQNDFSLFDIFTWTSIIYIKINMLKSENISIVPQFFSFFSFTYLRKRHHHVQLPWLWNSGSSRHLPLFHPKHEMAAKFCTFYFFYTFRIHLPFSVPMTTVWVPETIDSYLFYLNSLRSGLLVLINTYSLLIQIGMLKPGKIVWLNQ